MFTFAATPVKFVGLLVLFAWCTLWCGYELTRPQDGRQRVSNTLHLGMAVVMLLMVARPTWHRLTGLVPGWVLVGAFTGSTIWFAWLAFEAARASDRRGGLHFAGHALMFGAMTWHLAAMAVMAARMSGSGHGTGGMEAARQPGGVLWVFALVGLPFMTYLLAASVVAVRNLLRQRAVVAPVAPVRSCHEERPVGSATYRLAALGDLGMNFGMFWMSTGLMIALLPFFARFAF